MSRISLEFLSSHRFLWLSLAPAALALAVWVYYKTAAPLEKPARAVLRVLRGLAFLIVLFALAEPVLTLLLPEPGKPGLAVLVDVSASMGLPGSGTGGARSAEATALAQQIEQKLNGRFRLDWFGFDTGLVPREDPAPGGGRGNTAIGDVLEAVGSRQGTRPVAGIVLLTDGANTVGTDPVGAARNAGVPVFPVKIGGGTSPPDARVLQVRTNSVAFAGEPAPLEIEIASSGLENRSLVISVEDQGKILASQTVLLSGGEDLEQSIRLDVRPGAVGLRRWEVRLVDTKDRIPENDARSVAVRVLERKTRVLILEGRVDWDHAFLRRTLAADSTFGYRFLLCDRSGRWLPEQAGRPAPAGPGDLREYAAVVLGELPGAGAGPSFHAELAHYVQQGGGLLVLGGRSGIARLRGTALEPILPVEAAPGPESDRPLPVRLDPGGLTHPITSLADSPSRAEALWASLPPVWPSPDRIRTKPGASTLLSFATRAGAAPALAAGFAGDGKVAVLAAHDFWRWDFLPRGAEGSGAAAGEAYPEFALRLVRWLAEPTTRERFLAEPVRGVFENGESPEFSARVWNERYAPVPDARVAIRIAPGDAPATAPPLRQVDLRPRGADGTFVGRTDPLPPGTYRFTAEARSADGSQLLGRTESTFWIDANGPEFIRLRPDGGTLEQIARASSGEAVDATALDGLLARLPDVVRRVGRVREVELWNHLALFLSFVSLLSVEWFLRRRRGLA